MRRATVLGSSGFIGSHLSVELRRRGFDVSTPSRDADFSDRDLGTVFYCIGLTGDAPKRPADTVEAHVTLLARVLRECRFERLVYLSSTRLYLGAVAGDEDQALLIDPDDPGRLFNLSKATGEALVLGLGEPGRIARLSNVYGREWESPNFLGSIVMDACRHGAVRVRDAPDSSKDYVHVDDAVAALIHVGFDGGHRLYNVASGSNVTHGEVTGELSRITGCELKQGSDARTVVFPRIDVTRLSSELEFAPRSVLDDLPWLVDECRAWLRRSGAPEAGR